MVPDAEFEARELERFGGRIELSVLSAAIERALVNETLKTEAK
jgi:hypothetical protein